MVCRKEILGDDAYIKVTLFYSCIWLVVWLGIDFFLKFSKTSFFILKNCIFIIQETSIFPVQSLNCVWLLTSPGTVAHQAPLSIEFSKQEYWSGFPFPSPGDLADPEMVSASSALAGRFFTPELPGSPSTSWCSLKNVARVHISVKSQQTSQLCILFYVDYTSVKLTL